MPTGSTSNSRTDEPGFEPGPEWHERGEFPVEGPPAWPPVHPGEMLREVLDDRLRLSVAEAARRLRLSRQTLHAILAGRQAITSDVALRLERLGAGGARFWMDMQVGYDLETGRARLAALLDAIEPAA
jgi:antitoxin HigA-1